MTPNDRKRRRLVAEMNVVPYIDVMLVLLIIFMVTAPLLTHGIKVDLPKAGAEPLPPDMSETKPLILSVDAAGSYFLNTAADDQAPMDENAVVQHASEVLGREPKTPVLVKADQSVPYGKVITGMVLLQQAGAEKVGFITDPATARRARDRR